MEIKWKRNETTDVGLKQEAPKFSTALVKALRKANAGSISIPAKDLAVPLTCTAVKGIMVLCDPFATSRSEVRINIRKTKRVVRVNVSFEPKEKQNECI
jgi:hypothetical protein